MLAHLKIGTIRFNKLKKITNINIFTVTGYDNIFQVERHDTYTNVSMFIEWIERTILQNGGMNACGYILQNNFTDENDAGFQNGESTVFKSEELHN